MDITNLIVYGDSLSDPGNLSSKTFGFITPPEIFYKGRFSNGPVWVDYVQGALGWTVDNFAVGGAQTHAGSFPERLIVRSLMQQIQESRPILATRDPKSTLIVLWIGANDYLRNGDEFETKGRPNAEALTKGVMRSVDAIAEAVRSIHKFGFRKIVIGTIPELGGINRNPHARGYTATDQTLSMATRLHNNAVYQAIAALTRDHPEWPIQPFKAYDINKATYDDPKAFGFTVLDKPCFQGSLTGEFYGPKRFCDDPMGFKFWEYLHPNTRMQCYYAVQFLTDIHEAGWIEGFHADRSRQACRSL
jgi:outer membrane lipase/esterase